LKIFDSITLIIIIYMGAIDWVERFMGFVVNLLINAYNEALNYRINPFTNT